MSEGHYIENRPWGSFEILRQLSVVGSGLKDSCIKLLTIKPLARISYQSHQQRTEHWFVIQGQGQVILDGKIIEIFVGSSLDIGIGLKHRAINTSQSLDLKIVEIQTGHYDENDIERFEDDYGRV